MCTHLCVLACVCPSVLHPCWWGQANLYVYVCCWLEGIGPHLYACVYGCPSCPLLEEKGPECVFVRVCQHNLHYVISYPLPSLLVDLDAEDLPACCTLGLGDPPAYASPLGIPCPPRPGGGPRAGMHSPPPRPARDDTFESQPARRVRLGGGSRVLECPSIQITTISPGGGGDWDCSPRDYLSLEAYGTYREAPLASGFFTPSPASSGSASPWSFFSDDDCSAGDDVERELNEAAARFALSSPCGSPKPWASMEDPWPLYAGGRGAEDAWLALPPRPTSPCGKRRYSSSETHSSTSPCLSRRGSLGDEGTAEVADGAGGEDAPGQRPPESIPQKARKTSTEQTVALTRKEEGGCNGEEPGFGGPRKEGMDYLAVPSPLGWSKARIAGHSPIFRSSALPPLDWPLPSQYEQYELKIEVQPRSHHRAHYETEGSRGAVKAAPGGHPVVKLLGYDEKPLTLQMFIGTADERNLRPHAFYQVHRITGKMVATASYETIVNSTKVLEMSLLPENNMAANIDCAGILKLRNSDIELRKGETDIGRKNTRVRLVFRVHVPQGNGKVVSIQVASVPIECSQRSAQELPQVESCSISAGSVRGGEEMVLAGANFLPDSKVIFIERGPDGKLQWEEEACINRLKSNETTLTLTVPEYNNTRVSRPVQAYFYVSNGRRKRSPTQSFKYLPMIFKEEPSPDSPLRGFPPGSPSPGPPHGSPYSPEIPRDMDFSPSRPPFPCYPESTPYGASYSPTGYGAPSPYPDGPHLVTLSPPYRHCLPPEPPLRYPPVEQYGGPGLAVPPPFHPLGYRSPHFQPPTQLTPAQPPGEQGGARTPEWGEAESADSAVLEKPSGSGYRAAFRESLPIQGITLEEVTEIIGRDLSDFPEPPCEGRGS
ncbi:nuclear factor of activated T-cells, cytoplasmic 4 isoform X1 [Alligator mississippiensis]|uniref:nuclear factor of activated T-cells, cytoplasmic 4 isoform X1 n=2 Tax=Alligator mississippiensis TaxID=8496 RepID=UPI002877E974|nr:nuclear factor of activated T-cells, cytoplasmic 4 isoform X1 [Alligator mississippiensis]